MTLDILMADVPAYVCEKQERPDIDLNREYFAVTPQEFLIYSKQKKCWYCLITKMVVPGNISDIIDERGNMYLHVSGRPVTHGKWASAGSIDDILDLYNSGQYVEWLKSVS